ncbi:helix-turn-helix domain-containing protein [Bradyrhizobium arachidis]|nr:MULTISPECIES: helix-turn-helix domain-containing protein [Bradyrhizobium]UFW53756.1 helix-turn-helix domain-containing protein [Bradyrhizobium arachidis]
MYFHAHAKRRLLSDHVVNGVLLSPRELECLEWSCQGKSAADIGTILDISQRTVAFPRDNARAKPGVRTINQAIACLAEAKPRK